MDIHSRRICRLPFLIAGATIIAVFFYTNGNNNFSNVEVFPEADVDVKQNGTDKQTIASWTTEMTSAMNEGEWSAHWPKVNLRNCSEREFMDRGINSPDPKNNHFYRRTGIISSPGHGNTWTRHIIEQATGLWTGSVFNDKALYNGGFKGESEDCLLNSTVAIKAHSSQKGKCTFERAIVVVRNIYFGSLAEFNRKKGKSHTKSADAKVFNSTDWKNYVKKSTGWTTTVLIDMVKHFIKGEKKLNGSENPFATDHDFWKNLLLVSYERLKRDPAKEAERIVKFLGLPVFRRHCIEKDSDGHFKRQASEIPIECIYNDPELKRVMEKAVSRLSTFGEEVGAGNITSEFAFTKIAKRTNCPF